MMVRQRAVCWTYLEGQGQRATGHLIERLGLPPLSNGGAV